MTSPPHPEPNQERITHHQPHRNRSLFWIAAWALIATLAAAALMYAYRHRQIKQSVAKIHYSGGSVRWLRRFPRWAPTWITEPVSDIQGIQVFDWLYGVRLTNDKRALEIERDLDQIIDQMSVFRAIQELDLGEFTVNADQFERIADFGTIVQLNMNGTKISPEGFEQIGRMTQLRSLDLTNMTITDDDLKSLRGLQSLEYLTLDGTSVSDAGLEHLASLKNLSHLSLSNTDVTSEGVSKLHRERPSIDISDD